MKEKEGERMIKKVLLFVIIFTVIALGLIGCTKSQPRLNQSEYQLERNDLIMVNLGTVGSGWGSTGAYIFFFENYPTVRAFPQEVQIKFDPSLETPVVRAREIYQGGNALNSGVYKVISGVMVIFKNKEQMNAYWMVK